MYSTATSIKRRGPPFCCKVVIYCFFTSIKTGSSLGGRRGNEREKWRGNEEKRGKAMPAPIFFKCLRPLKDANFWLVNFDSRPHRNWTCQNMAFEEDVLSRELLSGYELEFTLQLGQEVAVVRALLKERDVSAVLPTQYGESLFTKCMFAPRTQNTVILV